MHTNTFPHSPDLDSTQVQPLFKERSSPLSLLAHELDSGLLIGRNSSTFASNGLSGCNLSKEKTPRRSLLSQLTATAFDYGLQSANNSGSSLICDLTVNMEQSKCASNQTQIFSSPLTKGEKNQSGPYSGKSFSSSLACSDSEMGLAGESDAMTVDPEFNNIFDSSASTLNPFSTDPQPNNNLVPTILQFERPATVFKPPKPSLKYRDQNGCKPPRTQILKFDSRLPPKSNITSHWNQRKPVVASNSVTSSFMRHKTMGGMVMVKKREGENYSPKSASSFTMNFMSNNSKEERGLSSHYNPRKIRRSMTFNGTVDPQKDRDVADIEKQLLETERFVLPSFIENGKDMLRRISVATLVDLLNGNYQDKIDEFHLIDCRYPFEYQGGHIKSATNINQIAEIQDHFFSNPVPTGKKVVIVFHCEYSIQRAPQMALYFRGIDRNINKDRYPYLNYPDIYILQGGYRDFYQSHKILCEPQYYVEMNDSRFEEERNLCMIAQKKDFPKSSGGFFH